MVSVSRQVNLKSQIATSGLHTLLLHKRCKLLREPFGITFDRSIKAFGWDTVKGSKVAIENDLVTKRIIPMPDIR